MAIKASAPVSEERAREVLASVVPRSWREGIITGKNNDWGHIRPSEAIRAMLRFATDTHPGGGE